MNSQFSKIKILNYSKTVFLLTLNDVKRVQALAIEDKLSECQLKLRDSMNIPGILFKEFFYQ
jgi:hypothetical protein